MKKIISLIMAVAMVFALCACGAKEEPVSAGMPNPVHECTYDELVQATGISVEAPAGAENVSYAYIDTESPISQVRFTYDGRDFCYRAQSTSYLSISANVNEDASSSDLAAALNDCTNIGAVLAGMHSEWKCSGLYDLENGRESVFAFNEGKEGFIAWLDIAPGVLYSLSVDSKAEQDVLIDMAELCFVPLQGDVG